MKGESKMGKAQEDYDDLSKVAEKLELDDDEKDNFISSGMKRLGHKVRQVWEDSDDDGKSESGDFFSSKRREQRPSSGSRSGKQRWSQYG